MLNADVGKNENSLKIRNSILQKAEIKEKQLFNNSPVEGKPLKF
jgi:hypothetical protein